MTNADGLSTGHDGSVNSLIKMKIIWISQTTTGELKGFKRLEGCVYTVYALYNEITRTVYL